MKFDCVIGFCMKSYYYIFFKKKLQWDFWNNYFWNNEISFNLKIKKKEITIVMKLKDMWI